jgi:hypothetical protein
MPRLIFRGQNDQREAEPVDAQEVFDGEILTGDPRRPLDVVEHAIVGSEYGLLRACSAEENREQVERNQERRHGGGYSRVADVLSRHHQAHDCADQRQEHD